MSEHHLAPLARSGDFLNVFLAAAFVVYWLATLQRSLICFRAYALRSLVVMAYTLWALGRHGDFVFNVEWVAWIMAWCHWLGAVTNAVYPDPRFRRKYVRAESR
jgi:hypothetical protein